MEPTPERCAQLRAHKALPRRRVVSRMHNEDGKNRVTSTSIPDSRSKDAAITSWIASSSPTLANTPQNLPPTPPSLPHDHSEIPILEASSDEVEKNIPPERPIDTNLVSTNQNTPPTPESTPPQKTAEKLLKTSPITYRFPSSTSQADSFKTAREYASSEADTRYKPSPDSEREAHGGVAASKLPSAPEEPVTVGLGLGLDLDERKSSSTMRTLRAFQSPQTSHAVVDDQQPPVGDDPFVVHETPAVQETLVGNLDHASSLSAMDTDEVAVPDDFQISLDRAFLLHERIDRERRATRTTIGMDLEDDDNASFVSNKSKAASPESMNREEKRVSQLSAGSSAVVEVYVRDTPRRRRQRLRHSSKNASLRDAGSPMSGSNRSSLLSNDPRPSLHHKAAMNSANRNRASMNSDSGISMGFDTVHKEEDINVSEMPNPRLSLKLSSRERRVGPQMTLESKQVARPGTAPDSQTPKLTETGLRHRSISDSGSQRRKGEDRGRELRRSKPNVPQRTSSLSAPTRRNRSTAATDALGTRSDDKQSKSLHDKRLSVTNDVPDILINRDSDSEDGARGPRLRPSLTRTPFSGISATSVHSSTPGPVELSEATAISIYPHNNKSLLVVQHSSKAGSSETRTSAHFTNNVTVELRQPPTLDSATSVPQLTTNRTVDSSRILPNRPAVMLIPPTPANALSQEEDDSETTSRLSRRSNFDPLSSIRRVFSVRRHSDTILSPFSRLAAGPASIPSRRRVKIESGSNALSPFWRPRGFWDDFSDSESEPDEELHYIRNTLGMPQPRVVPGPAALVRRMSSLKRRKPIFSEVDCRSTGRRASLPILRLKGRNGNSAIGTGLATEIRDVREFHNPIMSLYGSVMKKKAERKEAKQEKERDKLKRSIVPVMPPQSTSAFE